MVHKIKQLILSELKSITYYKSHLPNVTADSLYDKLSPGRKQLITPISESKEEFIAKWEKVEYEQKYSINVGAEYITEKGERVRSKSEILIANMLYKYNIPYHYEKPLKLKNRIIYPDFTILDTFSLKEYYWEHLGMLDDPEYATKTVVKLNSYEEAGIFTGESLILSRECKDAPLSTTQIKRIIKHYFSV